MNKITFEGKEYNIAFNLATEIEYYRLTGKNIDPKEFFKDGQLNPLEAEAILKAVIKVNNDGADPNEILMSKNRDSISVCVECVKAFFEWASIPEHAEDHVDTPAEPEPDDEIPNE